MNNNRSTLQDYLIEIPQYLGEVIIPVLMAIAFGIAVFNIVRYFIIQSSNEDAQEAARSQALYSIAAFVVILAFWGIVLLFMEFLDLWGANPACSDYAVQAGLCSE